MNSRENRELITGPFRPALEAALAKRLGAIRKADPGASVIVLVGSFALTQYLPRLVAEKTPLWNVHFVDFRGLIDRLTAPRLRSLGRRPLPDMAEKFIVRGVVRKLPKGYFEPVADLPGFITTAAASIKDVKEAGLPPAALARAGSLKLAAFKDVFAGYEKALEKLGFYDDADLAAAAADAAPESEFVTTSDLIAYGFYDLNGLQRRLLLALASAAKSATAMVPHVDAPAYEYARPLIDWLSAEGFAQAAAPAVEDTLSTRLFGRPHGEPLDASGFRILSAPGEPREVREVVRQVLAFAKRGIPFHEIGVLLRNPDAYSRLLRDALDAALRPGHQFGAGEKRDRQRSASPCFPPDDHAFFIAGGTPLSETREARGLQMLAELLASELRRADVMQFVHFAPIAFERLLGRVPRTSDWDLLTIEAGIVAGADEWTRRLDRLERRLAADEDASPKLKAELPHLRTFVDRLIDVKRALPASGSWKEIVDVLLGAYEQFTEPSDARDRVCGEVRKLCQLDQLGLEIVFADVRRTIMDLLGRQNEPSRGFQRGKVYVGGLFASRGLGFRAVIIPGLSEKSFPSTGRQDPILLDGERREISQRAGAGAYLPAKSARPAEERMLFALAVAAGAKRVTLTFSRLDVATARERVPSHFLVRLAEALTGEACNYATLETVPCFERVPMFPGAERGEVDLDLDDFDLRKVAKLVAGGRPRQVLYLAEVSDQFRRGLEAETARWQAKVFTKFDGIVRAAPHKTIAGKPMSATRIEAYAGCPFKYFLDRVLGISEIEEPEEIERMTPLDRGGLIHRILFAGYAACFKQGGAPSAKGLAAALRKAAEAECRKLGSFGPALTWAIDRAEIFADLDRFAALDAANCQAAGARPVMFETRFGMQPRGGGEDEASTEMPLELNIKGKTYKFKGKIDRIDEVGTNAARVIDYKTGKKTGKPDAFGGGRALQLPIYILAAQMLRPERQIASAEYSFATARGEFGSVEFTREALDQRMAEFEHILVTIERCIENGIFIAKPDDSHCRYCDFKDVCGANKGLLFDRKRDDPAVADLLALGEIE